MMATADEMVGMTKSLAEVVKAQQLETGRCTFCVVRLAKELMNPGAHHYIVSMGL